MDNCSLLVRKPLFSAPALRTAIDLLGLYYYVLNVVNIMKQIMYAVLNLRQIPVGVYLQFYDSFLDGVIHVGGQFSNGSLSGEMLYLKNLKSQWESTRLALKVPQRSLVGLPLGASTASTCSGKLSYREIIYLFQLLCYLNLRKPIV